MRIFWTKGAQQNLDHIEEYIAQDNPFAAVNTVLKIIKTVESLKDHPDMGRPGRIIGTRELVISRTPYIIPYRIQEKRIDILRVLHGALQWPEHID